MKLLTRLVVIAVLGVGIFGAMAGCARHFAHKTPQERAEWLVKKINDELKLNNAQLGNLNALKDELLAVRSDYRKRDSNTRKTVDELLSQPTLDQARVLAMVRERTRDVNDKAPQVVAAFAKFYDSLTPQQQKKLHDDINEWMKRRDDYWHGR
ncbi:MAG: Spy/CpxP family protein refolding chaperone [Gammaproteobacteria bacterium]|jgi:protein CpxP